MRANTEVIFESLRNAVRQFFRAGHNKAQAAEIFRRAAARVSVQEGRRRKQHGDRVLVDKSADDARIERIRVEDHADAGGGGQAKRAGKTKRVKERKNAHDAIVGVQHENLVELLHI